MANSETKDLYEIGGAYYYDDIGTKRASADDQAAYLIGQATSDPANTTLADMGYANPQGGWAGTDTSSTGNGLIYSNDYSNNDDYTPMGDTRSKYGNTEWTGMGNLYNLPDGSKLRYDGSTVGLISALNKYYGEGGWSDGKTPDSFPKLSTRPGSGQVPKSPGLYKDPNDGLTYGYTLDKSGNRVWGSAGNEWAYPEDMSGGDAMTWNQALARAGGQLNPVYDTQRDRQEVAASQNREMLPQLMAARYGMSGTKGGRIGSQITKSVQAEGSAINAIEGERTRGINELAQGLYEQDQARVERQLALQAEQERIAQGWAQINNAQANAEADRKMAYDFRYLDEERFLKTYGLSKEQFAYEKMTGDRAFNEGVRQFDTSLDWEKQQYADDMAYKQAALTASGSGGTGGTGGSGGGDLTANQADQSQQAATKWVTERVNNDPRLLPDGSNYWVLADAWKNMYVQMTYGK